MHDPTATIGVLVPPLNGTPAPPEAHPIGRAALQLEAEGLAIVFGHQVRDSRLSGLRAGPNGWRPALDCAIGAAYDRFPSQTRPTEHRALLSGLGGVPVANPSSVVELCRDKVLSQLALEAAGIAMPPVVPDPLAFSATLAEWRTAFLKPRFGSFGRGVRRVMLGDALPATGPGAVPGRPEPTILQRAIEPPAGWAGVTCRVLVQRDPQGRWYAEAPAARRDRHDPVVNAARGAEVVPLQVMAPDCVEPTQDLATAAARALAHQPDGDWLLEVGVDVALDAGWQPHVIEVNGRPRGRLEALADLDDPSWRNAHVAACARPLRTLAAWASREPSC